MIINELYSLNPKVETAELAVNTCSPHRTLTEPLKYSRIPVDPIQNPKARYIRGSIELSEGKA